MDLKPTARALRSIVITASFLALLGAPAAADAPHIFGFHSWDNGCGLDVMSGKTGWYVRYQIIWQGVSLSDLEQAKSEGFTIIMSLFDTWTHEIPVDRDRWPEFASQCAAMANYVKDYCRIFHLDNEMEGDMPTPDDFTECFRMVRDAIQGVHPDALVTNGGVYLQNWFEPMARRLGAEIDGYQSHVNIPVPNMAVLETIPGGQRKPYYITEFTNHTGYTPGWLQGYYYTHNQWNQTHEQTSACACWFVYNLGGWEAYSIKYLPLQNADYKDITANNNYTNDYAERPITVYDLRIDTISGTSANVQWKTNVASTTQVEWYPEGATQAFYTPFETALTKQHEVTFNGVQQNVKFHMCIRSTAHDYGDSWEWVTFGTNISQAPGTQFRAGWNLIAVPLVPGDPRVEAVLDTSIDSGNDLTNAVFRYDDGYDMYPGDFTLMERGRGYWVRLSTATYEYCEGLAETDPVALPLQSGWTLIGQPHDYETLLADCQVSNGASTVWFDDAVSAGWIGGTLYNYKYGGYETCQTSGGDDSYLRPWYGYWVLTQQPGLSIIIP